jgi:hypothetical protein
MEHYKETDRESTFSGRGCTSLLNDEKLKDLRNVANVFINFFLKITEKLNFQQIQKEDATLIMKDSVPGNISFFLEPQNSCASVDQEQIPPHKVKLPTRFELGNN